MKNNWTILDRAGKPKDHTLFPSRPSDSNSDESNPYTPWYRTQEHIHFENGEIEGIHANANLADAQKLLSYCLENEKLIMDKFDTFKEDVELYKVLKYLAIVYQENRTQ